MIPLKLKRSPDRGPELSLESKQLSQVNSSQNVNVTLT